jgi:LPXTG-motif cell wall-anchored protein
VPTTAPTETPAPATLTPTSTPVVDDTTDEEAVIETEEGAGTETDSENTNVSDEETDQTDAENGTDVGTKGDGDASPTPISALSEAGDGSNGEALPQTGLDSWGIVVAAFVLVGLLIFVRRLRTVS